MQKFTFSNEGFQAMQSMLYALPDAELATIANAVSADFEDWMNQNFELSESQQTFIQNLSPPLVAFLATQTSFFMVNRLPILLTKPEDQLQSQLRGSKLIRPKSRMTASSEQPDGFNLDGVLEIEIIYG